METSELCVGRKEMRVIQIEKCYPDCPFFRDTALDGYWGWCKKAETWIPLSLQIPDWCPLEAVAPCDNKKVIDNQEFKAGAKCSHKFTLLEGMYCIKCGEPLHGERTT